MSPYDATRAQPHDSAVLTLQELLEEINLETREGAYERDEPDLFLGSPGNQIPLEIKTVNKYGRVSISKRQLAAYRRNYRDLYLGIVPHRWKTADDFGFVSINQLLLFDTHTFVGDGKTANEIEFLSIEVPKFWIPRPREVVERVSIEREPIQLGMDGRETPVSQVAVYRHLGETQRDILNRISFWPATGTEIGTYLHAIGDHSMCGVYARDSKYSSPYTGLGCCGEASSRGSSVAKSLDGPLVKRPLDDRWTLAPENWYGS